MTARQDDFWGNSHPVFANPIKRQLAMIMTNEPKTQLDEDLLTIRWLAMYHTRLVYNIKLDHLREIVQIIRKADIRRRRQELAHEGYPWPEEEAERRQNRAKGGPR